MSLPLNVSKDDYGFVGNILVGEPAQTFRCVFDTGSTNSWLRSVLVALPDHMKDEV